MLKKKYYVEWRGTNVFDQAYSDRRICETEQEMNKFVFHLIHETEGVEKIWKTTVEEMTIES
jgi:hypothetical protein